MKPINLLVAILLLLTACSQPEPQTLVVATVSMIAKTDTAANLKTLESYMKKAAKQGAQLIVFPEIALQQNPGWGFWDYYPTKEEKAYFQSTAETIPGESTDWLTARAQELDIYVIFGMTERGEDGFFYNTSVFLGPEGIIASYRKHTIWEYAYGGNEAWFWTPGQEEGMVVESPLGKIGMLICIEMGLYYESFFDQNDIDMVVVISATPQIAFDFFEESSVKSAQGCNCWLAVSNQVGKVGQAIDYGHSRIVDPTGKIVADTGTEEGMVIIDTGLPFHANP